MNKQGILILSHVGYSFVDQLANQAATLGMERYIFSSLPESARLGRIEVLEQLGEWFGATQQHQLSWDEVKQAIDSIHNEGKAIAACVCVWEGYRGLMAQANAYLGVKDISPKTVDKLTDKYGLRRFLFQNGLSAVKSEPLSKDNLLEYQRQDAQKFIKPYRGIASFGTFRLTKDVTWADIEALHKALKSDTVYQAIFADKDPFIIEDYISGTEYSFEILVEDTQQSIVAIHEKAEVSLERMTTLENTCVSPPVSLNSENIDAARSWLEAIFQLLAIDSGCFHVEAKFTGTQWELIEINPRVGGALISQSVEYLTGGYSLLSLWLRVLLQSKCYNPETSELLQRFAVSGQNPSPQSKASFFRVFFADVGTIAAVEECPQQHQPIVSQVFIKSGDCFTSVVKENFAGQVLWALDWANLEQSFLEISRQSQDYLKISYQLPSELSAAEALEVNPSALLVVDFNLSRRVDVAHIRQYAARHYGKKMVLIRHAPSSADWQLADYVVDLDPLCDNFVEEAMVQLSQLPVSLDAGLVFSDNAVHTGAKLLASLELRGDCSILSENAFCKYKYRIKEQSCKDMLQAQKVFVPNMQKITSIDCLAAFIADNPDGVVIKPTTEGNNRGVILLDDPANADLTAVLEEVSQYIKGGVIAEQMIPFSREYSYDGLGDTDFITEKFNATGRYPVEFAQLVPADIDKQQADLIRSTGKLANLIVGQHFGPFHNEIRIADDFSQAAVIEANRRPAGMKIWSLASAVFEQDLYGLWIDSVITDTRVCPVIIFCTIQRLF